MVSIQEKIRNLSMGIAVSSIMSTGAVHAQEQHQPDKFPQTIEKTDEWQRVIMPDKDMFSIYKYHTEEEARQANREYAQANKEWLTAKAQEEGVKPLPKGIYYKVLAEGKADGKHPTPRSIVTAHYSGRTIDGKQFDSSRGGAPLAIRLCDLIEGWIIAMQQMCVGDKWEVYIPAEMGYGKFSQPGIPGGSSLIFEIELLGIA